jgi:hypothetical protein
VEQRVHQEARVVEEPACRCDDVQISKLIFEFAAQDLKQRDRNSESSGRTSLQVECVWELKK